jgi:hypothetical protein
MSSTTARRRKPAVQQTVQQAVQRDVQLVRADPVSYLNLVQARGRLTGGKLVISIPQGDRLAREAARAYWKEAKIEEV